jgi:hypothetical protein
MTSCAELTMDDAEEAALSADSMRALLAWAAEIARPGQGAPKVLMAIARLPRADWVAGTCYVEIKGTASATTLSVVADRGMGLSEHLLPQTVMQVPVDEFARAVRLAPQLIAPLRALQHGDALILAPAESTLDTVIQRLASAHEHVSETSSPPPLPKRPQSDPGVHTHPTVRRLVAIRAEALPPKKE